ncbi:hypothetical protein QTP86_019095 [Hemibagrus guttatus]|nr:hypothetical protein QTP86_019095 [Hemibagrus guttatus]
MFLSVLLLLAASSYVECAVELTQDTSVMLKPGDSLTLSCKVSGYSVTDDSKFSISKDASSSTVTLRGQNMQTEDTAVYYCARYTHSHTTSCSAAQKPHLHTSLL